jgi:hypothetical protein
MGNKNGYHSAGTVAAVNILGWTRKRRAPNFFWYTKFDRGKGFGKTGDSYPKPLNIISCLGQDNNFIGIS